jgi:phage virion morphogenesis protein
MTGISISAELHDEEARHRLQELLSRMDRLRPFYTAVGERLLRSAALNFDRQSGPDGRAWKPLAAATVKARTRKGQTPLTILRSNSKGKVGSPLAGSINYQADDAEVRIGSPKEYAAIHQLGGTIQKPARAAKIYRMREADGSIGRRFAQKSKADVVTDVTIPAHTVTIPSRPFIGISRDDEGGILEDAEAWLKL